MEMVVKCAMRTKVFDRFSNVELKSQTPRDCVLKNEYQLAQGNCTPAGKSSSQTLSSSIHNKYL